MEAATRAVGLDATRRRIFGALAKWSARGVVRRDAGHQVPGKIKSDLETVLRIDPGWQQGSADRALGRWYAKVPGMFGGSDKDAEAHYRASLKYNPTSTASLFFLAELLQDRKRRPEALQLLQRVVDAPLDPDWAPEDREFKSKARALLATSRAAH